MTYSDKVKASKDLLTAIHALEDKQHVVVEYGVDYRGEALRYRIEAYQFGNREKSFRINKDELFATDGMNIEKFSGTKMYAYSYDLMGTKTTYNFPLYAMKLVKQPFAVKENTLTFEA